MKRVSCADRHGAARQRVLSRRLLTVLSIMIMAESGFAIVPEKPSLYTPANNSTGVDFRPSFWWSSVSNGNSYKIQVCKNQWFGSDFAAQGTNLSSTSWTPPTNLPEGTKLWWRVIAYNSYPNNDQADHTVSDVSVFTTKMNPPGVPTLSSPVNTAMNVSTTSRLVWYAPSSNNATSYDWQLGRTSDLSSPIQSGSVTVTTVPPSLQYSTTYFWRVRSVNTAGTSNWTSPYRFFTQSRTSGFYAPNEAVQYAYRYTSEVLLGLAYNPSYLSYSSQYAQGSPGGCSYASGSLYCNGDCTNFVSQCLKAGGLTLSGGLLDSRGCLFRVNELYNYLANIYNKNCSAASQTKTGGLLPNNFRLVPGDIIQFGQSSDDPRLYAHSVIVTRVTDAGSLDGINITCHNGDHVDMSLRSLYPNHFNTAHFHHMDCNTTGVLDNLAITEATEQTQGGYVSADAQFVAISSATTVASCDWSLQFEHAGGFYTLASATVAFNNPEPRVFTSRWSVLAGALPTGYDWVRNSDGTVKGSFTATCMDSDGAGHSATAPISYLLPREPALPGHISPASGTLDAPGNPTLQWEAILDAASYRLQVSRDPFFITIDIDRDGLTSNSCLVENLLEGTTYYWRVHATNAYGSSLWTDPWHFTIAQLPPAVPQPVSPASGASNVSPSPTLRWEAAARAESYRVQLTRDPTKPPQFDRSGIAGTTVSCDPLLTNTEYLWRVNATNSVGTSNWSAWQGFKTLAVSPVLERVVSNNDGTFTAVFGYSNPGETAVTIPIGPANRFVYNGIDDLGQPTTFLSGRQTDQFEVVFNGENCVWVLNGHTSTASGSAALLPVSPVLERVLNNYDGSYTAIFGYSNPNQIAVTVPIGSANRFVYNGHDNLGQPTTFLPGRKTDQFAVVFNGENCVWVLDGRTATANGSAAVGGFPVSPVLERVINNCNGTFTAVFGYKNSNIVPVTVPIGAKNRFSYNGTDNLGQPTVFQPGRNRDVFSVVFSGSNLVWVLYSRTSTASGTAAKNVCPQ